MNRKTNTLKVNSKAIMPNEEHHVKRYIEIITIIIKKNTIVFRLFISFLFALGCVLITKSKNVFTHSVDTVIVCVHSHTHSGPINGILVLVICMLAHVIYHKRQQERMLTVIKSA